MCDIIADDAKGEKMVYVHFNDDAREMYWLFV